MTHFTAIDTASQDAWTRAIEERNWAIFAITKPEDGSGKLGKFPTGIVPSEYQHERGEWGQPISVYDAARWTFSEACQQVKTLTTPPGILRFAVGYLPRPGSALVVGDLDNCRDPLTGAISPWAAQILALGSTYAEVSTSGTGVRLLMERQPGDDQHTSGERNCAGIFANGSKGAVLTFQRLNDAMPVAAPEVRDAILRRKGVDHRRTGADPATGEDYGDVTVDMLRIVVEAMPNDGQAFGYDDWIKIGHVIKLYDDGPDGFAIWSEWSDRRPSHLPRTQHCAKKWHGLKPTGDVRFGTLIHELRRVVGPELPQSVQAMLDQCKIDRMVARMPASGLMPGTMPGVPPAPTSLPGVPPSEWWTDVEPVDVMQPLLGTPLPEHCVPPLLRPLLALEAPAMGVPAEILFAACVGGAVAAMDDRWMIRPHPARDWVEHPRLWQAVIGNASIKKTPGINFGLRPVRALEREQQVEDARRIAHYEAELKRYEAELKRYTDGKIDAPPDGIRPSHPETYRAFISDATTAKLSDILLHNPRGVTMERDELSGWLASVEGRGEAAKDRAAYLQLYNGGTYMVDRVGRGSVHVPNWSASIIGGIQPSALQAAMRNMPQDGLLQRFYPVIAHQAMKATNDPVDPAFKNAYVVALRQLWCSRVGQVTLSPDAARILHGTWDDVYSLVSGGTLSEAMVSHLSKWEGGIYRWALVLHGLESAAAGIEPTARTVSAETAQVVSDLHMRFFLPNVFALYGQILGERDDFEHVRKVAAFLLGNKTERLRLRDLGRSYRAWRPLDDTQKRRILRYLEDVGWLQPEDRSFLPSVWDVNQNVYVRFAEEAERERKRRVDIVQSIGK